MKVYALAFAWPVLLGLMAAVQGQEPAPAAVAKKPPVPDASGLKPVEAQVRELFKDQYAKKNPDDKKALARKLLQEASSAREDDRVRYVLLKEAREIAAQFGDVETGLAAAAETARFFDVDGFSLKLAVMGKIESGTKDAIVLEDLAELYAGLADEAAGADNYEAAKSAVSKAALLAKKTEKIQLGARMRDASSEIDKLSREYSKVKVAAVTPETMDILAVGSFFCFGKGDWTKGLPFLAQLDSVVGAAAKKDLAGPMEAEEQVTVGDAWWDIAEKEASPIRKSRIRERAKLWYEKALSNASGLSKVRLEKRLKAASERPPAVGVIDLLKLIEIKKDLIRGTCWALTEGNLQATRANGGENIVRIPYSPPVEYDMSLDVEVNDVDGLVVGLVAGEGKCQFVLDGWNSTKRGLEGIDGKHIVDNGTAVDGRILPLKGKSRLDFFVRRESIEVHADGKNIFEWTGNTRRFSTWWPGPTARVLWIGLWKGDLEITNFVLTPITGKGQPMR